MSEAPFTLEPERYELQSGPDWLSEMDRRSFFRLVGGGIIVLSFLREAPAFQESGGRRGRGGFGAPMPKELGAWLHIGEDGKVTVYTGKAEVGQNIRTSLTQVVAEELHAPMESISLVMADTAKTPFDMGTFGSRTTPTMSPQLRRAAAAARELLIDLAAERWKVERDRLTVADGRVTDGQTHQSIEFGKLTEGKKLLQTIRDDQALTPPARWTVAGKPVPKVDGRATVTGRHQFASDVQRPGMLRGKVLRAPAVGAKLKSVDTGKAKAMPGVVVVQHGDLVGVVAPDEQTATQALKALSAEWTDGPQPSDTTLFEDLKKPSSPAQGSGGFGGPSRQEAGSVKQGLESADEVRSAAYTVAYIAHAPLEPRAAVAEWDGDRLTVWTGSQRPFGVRGELAQAFHMPEDKIRVIVPDTGAGYGGKHTGEAAVEAARLAKAAGKPVKLLWTREEEFTFAYLRPAGVIEVKAGVRKDGTITAWEFHNYNSGASGIRTPYAIANEHIEFHATQSPLRQGSYRALAATANHFAREVHIDDLAHAVKQDPLEFRLKNLKDEQVRAVLKAAAERFGWGRKAEAGRGYGLACGFEKGGYVATCAEVSVDRQSGRVKVERAVTAFECGAIVNPDHLRNQVEGAVVMGLGGALFEAIHYRQGKLRNPRFSRYRVPRFRDLPALETVLIDRKDLPSAGAGETPIVAIAPAVGNAIFDVTGVRLRSMPLVPDGFKS